MRRLLMIMAMLVTGVVGAWAQEGKTWRKADIYLDPEHPGVYVAFDRVEKTQGIEWVWVRLHNNMRWEIRYETHGGVDLRKDGVDAESIQYTSSTGHGSWSDYVKLKELRSGEFIYFRVRLSDITSRGWAISTNFKYGWERETGEPRHAASFSFFDLPKRVRETLCRGWKEPCS